MWDGQPAAETSGREEPPHPWPSAPLVPTLSLCPQVPVGFIEMGRGEMESLYAILGSFSYCEGFKGPCVAPSEELPAQSCGGESGGRERNKIRASGRPRAK